MGIVGVQRKVFPGDFLASVKDGRLYEGLMKMKGLGLGVLMLEGRGEWTTDGNLVTNYGQVRWDRTQHFNYLVSLQLRGITCLNTDTLSDTLDCIRGLQVWSNKTDHTSLDVRPAPDRVWGKITNKDYQLHLIKSLPGINVKRAGAILNTLGMPFGLRVTEKELITVPGIGKGLARKIMEVFQDDRGN